MADTQVDTSIYKNSKKPPDFLGEYLQAMQPPKQGNSGSSGDYSEPPHDTLTRLGAGTPYGG